jgi:hypothetical protein
MMGIVRRLSRIEAAVGSAERDARRLRVLNSKDGRMHMCLQHSPTDPFSDITVGLPLHAAEHVIQREGLGCNWSGESRHGGAAMGVPECPR